ncbi:MAG: copper-translocating P-type ATPase [Bacteroidota bacterium]|nr:MAG: copper-translocating P-type ATPase [Bacteroidota bacterium]
MYLCVMNKNERIELNVQGMSCTNCALSVKKTLEKQGAENISVDFSSGETIFFKPPQQALSLYIKSIEEAGYKVANTQSEKNFFTPERKFLFCFIFTFPLLLHMFIHWHILHHPLVQFALTLPVMLVGFPHFAKSAWNSLKNGIPNMDVLISIGSSSAFIYSIVGYVLYRHSLEVSNYLFFETAASIITLVLLGNLMEHRSVRKTTSAIKELTALQKVKAKKIQTLNHTETIQEIEAENICIGDILLVNSGDKIPVDGKIIWGEAYINEAMLTGESIPNRKGINANVIGGTIVDNGSIKIKAEKIGNDTTLSKIISLVKSAQQNQPNIQKLGDKVSAVFVPIVILISFLTFILSVVFFSVSVQQSLMNAIAVLVISCPCAMGLATPTAVMVGVGRLAKKGILIKGGNTIETLAKAQYFVFDKTGTITTGKFKINTIKTYEGISENDVRSILYSAEKHSSHPIAKSIVEELTETAVQMPLHKIIEIKGKGLSFSDNENNNYLLGSSSLSGTNQNEKNKILLFKNRVLISEIFITDELKKEVKETISALIKKGITPILLSGDTESKCKEVAALSRIEKVYYEKSPEEKLQIIESYSQKGITVMVGDGINDAPALSKAHIGISLSNATDVAIQSANIILLSNQSLYPVYETFAVSQKTLQTIKQNLFWAFFYNSLAIPIAAAGFLSPIVAALSMAFSDVIVVGNSLWLKVKKTN